VGVGLRALYEAYCPPENEGNPIRNYVHYFIASLVFCSVMYLTAYKLFDEIENPILFHFIAAFIFGYSGFAINIVIEKLRRCG